MSSDLSPAEKEERQVERLIDKDPAPSRKNRPKRGPKHDNRRRRMKTEDPDMKGGDPDMSLNRKTQGAIQRAALRIFLSAEAGPLESALKKFEDELRNVSSAVADDFLSHAREELEWAESEWDEEGIQDQIRKISEMSDRFHRTRKDTSNSLRRAGPDEIVRSVVETWPSGQKESWAERAAVLAALESAIDKIPLPQSYKIPFLRGDISDNLRDQKLLRKLIETAGQTYSMRNVEEEAILHFAQLASAYRVLQNNPDSIDAGSLRSGMEDLSKGLQEQTEELLELGSILEAWNDISAQFKSPVEFQEKGFESVKDYDKILKDLDSFFSDSKLVDPDPLMSELSDYTRSRFKELPPELEGAFEQYSRAAAAASNEAFQFGIMSERTATYHGVDCRDGNPVQPPNTGYKSFHSRNFTEENYKAILAYAEALLDQPWYKYNWDGSARDAQFRAALDTAIHMADENLYQSKIDSETYNLLYNRLAKAGHDSFSETVIPVQDKVGQKRSAAMRNSQAYKNIVRVASDLRSSNPAEAFEIIKSLRSLVSSEAESADTIGSHIALEETSAEPSTSMDSLTGQAPGKDITFFSLGEDDFNKLKDEMQRDVEKLFAEDDVEEFMKGFENIISDFEKKTASSLRDAVPLSVLIKLAASSQEAKRILGPVIIAAKKKKDAKKGKKDDKAAAGKKEKSDEPFGGKGAPPFEKGKGKGKGKGKKRKAHLSKDDINW